MNSTDALRAYPGYGSGKQELSLVADLQQSGNAVRQWTTKAGAVLIGPLCGIYLDDLAV